MPVVIEIYRTTVRPEGKELWGFEPFGYSRLYRADGPTGGTIEASPEPFAVVDAPDHVEVAPMRNGRTAAFLWPGSPGFSARLVYSYAAEGKFGLSLAGT